MADTVEDVQMQGGATGIPGLGADVFENLLIAMSAGENVEGALNAVRDSMRNAAIDAGNSDAAADQAADMFLETLQNEIFLSNRSPLEAAEYAEQAMQHSIETFGTAPAASPADALLAAIASGDGVDRAVSNVVADMISNGATSQDQALDPAAIEAAFLNELQDSLAQGGSPQDALASASSAAEAQLVSQQQASVPIENTVLSSLANGQNVGDALSDAAQQAGGDANAFADGLEAALSNGMGADDALADATQAASDSDTAKQDSAVELDAAGRLAQSLAQGDGVSDAMKDAGGGEAFAATLEESLASGKDAGQALADADSAQQQHDANSDAQSVPLSPADKLAAALANGIDAETLSQLSGNSAFADTLEQSLASGQSPFDAMADAQQAAQEAAAVANAQDVPLSPADQLAASLASGENVDQAMAGAGQGDAFGDEMIASLADGQAPGDALADATDAQQSADATSQNQSVPSDPNATALAQGGDATDGVDMAQAVADATGTTGGDTNQGAQGQGAQGQGGQEAAQQSADGSGSQSGAAGDQQPAASSNDAASQQTASNQTGENQAGGDQAGGDQAGENTGPATKSEQVASDDEGDESQQQVAAEEGDTQTGDEPNNTQTDSETADSVEQVAQGPGEDESNNAAGDDDVTGEGVTQTIQVADAGDNPEGQGAAQNQADDSAPEGGGSDGPTDEEIAALQELASAAGGNTNPNPPTSSGPSFNDLLNPGPFGGGQTNQTQTQTSFGTTTNNGPKTQPQPPSQGTTTSQTTTPENLKPIAVSDTGAGTENQTLSLSVLNNDSDPDGQPLTIIAANVVSPGKGTVQINGSVVTFTPGSDFDALDAGDTESVVISYTVSDGAGGTATSTATVDVTGTNDVPEIVLADSTVTGTVTEATDNAAPKSPPLLAEGEVSYVDLDADGTQTVTVTPSIGAAGVLSAAIVTPSAGATGTIAWNYAAPEGFFDFLANGQTATEVFRITVTDDQGTSTFQDITVTVVGTNDSPVAIADVSATSENSAVSIDVIANDFDVDNNPATLSLTGASVPPGQGTVSIVGNQIVYDPGTDFITLAAGDQTVVQISYTVTDPGGLTSTSVVDVTISGSNNQPIVAAPLVVAPVTEDSGAFTIDLLDGASDIDAGTVLNSSDVVITSSDGHIVSFSVDNQAGALTINSGQFGYLDDGEDVTLSVTYNVIDQDGGSVPNTASVSVTGANDAPRFLTTGVTIASENYESGAAGWTDSTVTFVDGLTQFLGNFGQGGATEKQFVIPHGANGASFSFDLYKMDSWDAGETFTISLNGVPTVQKQFDFAGGNDDSHFTLQTQDDVDLGIGPFNDQVYRVKLNLSAAELATLPDDGFGGKIITLGFSSTLDQGAHDESWGVDNLRIAANVEANGFGQEDTTIAINGLKVGDVDGDTVTVTIQAPDGILALTDGGAGAVLQNSGTGNVTVSGTTSQVNAALATLSYTPEADANGSVPISLSVNDGTATTNSSFDVIVTPVDDATIVSAPESLLVNGAGIDGDDASFSFASAENFNTFPTTQGTVELWLKTPDLDGAVASYAVPGSPNELWITLSGGDIQIWFNNQKIETITTANVSDDEWHHLALTFGPGAGDTVFYVDGVPVVTMDPTVALDAGGTLVLGADQDAVGGDFETAQALVGEIDNVRVWNSVRSQADINDAMQQTLDPSANPDLVADYRMNGTPENAVEGGPDLVLNNADLFGGGPDTLSGFENQPVLLSNIDISDVDGDTLTVTLTSGAGTVTANLGGGAAILASVPGGVTITGSVDDVNAAMDTASFTPNPGFLGDTFVDINVDDGSGPPVFKAVPVTIAEPPNAAPTVTTVLNASTALYQDGFDSKSTIQHSDSMNFGDATPLSVEMRIKTSDDINLLQTLFDKSDTSLGDSSPFRLHIKDGTLSVWNSSAEPSTAAILKPDTWYDIGVSYDGATLKIYIDGVLQADEPFTMGPANDSPWNIGDDHRGDRDFRGLVEELRVWNVALSEGDVQSHLGTPIADPANEPGLVALYNFDSADNGEVVDQTGHSNPVVLSPGSDIVPVLNITEGEIANSSLVATDADGDPLTYFLGANALNGNAAVNPDGSFSYTPNPGFIGLDVFSIQVDDGQGGVVTQQVAVDVAAPLPNVAPFAHGTSFAPVADFTGTESYVDVPPSLVNGMTEGTIETWVYLDDNANARIFSQQANFTNTMALLSIENGQVSYKSHNGSGTILSTTSINAGEWHHIAVTFSADEANLYIDGHHDAVLAGPVGLGFSIPTVDENLVNNASIGAMIWDNGREFMDGQLSEFRIWDTARTGQQIADNYLVQADGTEPDLRALYDFSDPIADGTPVVDQAGAFNGTSHDVQAGIADVPGLGDPSLDPQNAFVFDGNNVVTVDHNAALDPGTASLTVETWFYWAGDVANNDLDFLVSKGNTVDSNDPGYSISINDDTLMVRTSTGDGTNKGESEISLIGLSEGWHHVAMVIDQSGPTSEIRGYLDGSDGGWGPAVGFSNTFDNGAITVAESLTFGARNDGLGDGYEGALDDVRIWNTARSAEDIQRSMTHELTGGENGLVGYWNFNDTVPSSVADVTGNGHDGTVSGTDGRENLVDFSVSSAGNYKGLLLGGDVNGDQLQYTILDAPEHGNAVLDGNTFVYAHDGSLTDHDTFTVEISDGTDTITQHIDVTVV